MATNVWADSRISHTGARFLKRHDIEQGPSRLEISASLISAARAGDPEAVTALFRAAWPAAYRIARSLLNDSAIAEDAAQEACAKAMQGLQTLRRPELFVSWFYRIVVNEAKQRLRAAARRVAFESTMDEKHRTADSCEADSHAERIDVRRAIDSLEPGLRTAIVLRYYLGMESAEIGRILSISPVTARWRIMVAHRKLRDVLRPAAIPSPVLHRSCADEV